MIDANADDDELVDELYLDDESKNRYESLIDDEKKIRKAKKSWTAKLNELKKQQATSRKKIHRHHNHAKDLSQQKSREMQAIESAINQHGIKLKKRQQESWRFVVEARNVFTKRRLSQDNRSFLPKDSSLNVFCVSNTHYAASKGVSFIHGNRLSVDQTGLPALRKFVRQQVAGAKLRAVEDYIRHDFTVFIQSLHLWCGLFSEADVNGLLCDIQAKQNEMQTIIAKCTNTLHKETSAIMLDHVEAGQIHMTKSALQVWKSKEKMHWQTLRTFIRQDGNHETQKVSHESWNEQFFKETIEFMGYSGEERLFGRLEKACNELEKSLLKLLDEIPRTVGQHAASVMLPEKPLNMFIEAEKYGIARHCEQFQASIRKEFRNAKLDLTVDRPSAFFAQAMAQAYRMYRNKRGRGSKENVQTTMKTHLSLGGPTSPFHQTADLFQKAIKMDIERTSAVLTKNVKVIMEQIHHHCSYMINAKKTDTSEEQLKVSLRDFLCGRDTGYQHFEDIKADLKRIKRRYIDVEA
ncbi:uncharacterized protein K489DRAFT_366486 [Dissoconium aciculare CBS 342.82]|uniref:DUF7605 domain-containing protein n=1 Tax=Dissoconium aciculare CBS 342.82 TaxID=1314786 RepID=A0A6J3MH89_9PEZI|nr:uncharacterized protein K489DRAFT_366486 [Dissoconium aciculare CBS 342.82]KAF1827316.1 hypothetical protein K489DRAFT_366486 [Dissoconium aciculare CBS 342.82]